MMKITSDVNGWVATIGAHRFTREELSAYFDRVKNAENWKRSIDARIPAATSERDLLGIREAVIFYTGSVPTFTVVLLANPAGVMLRVESKGYYVAVGA